MKIPISYYATCPNCKQESTITILNAGAYWLTNSWWKCPYCKDYSTTKELQKEEKKNDKIRN